MLLEHGGQNLSLRGENNLNSGAEDQFRQYSKTLLTMGGTTGEASDEETIEEKYLIKMLAF